MHQLIKQYEGVLTQQQCSNLIHLFEDNPSSVERIENDGHPQFSQINWTALATSEELHHQVCGALQQSFNRSFTDIRGQVPSIENYLPEKNGWEQLRIKKYYKDKGDIFKWHVDVQNHATARRYLAGFIYLNDVKKGGHTSFGNVAFTPEMGKMIVFPPMWMFSHAGQPPISNDKYLLSTYLHYV